MDFWNYKYRIDIVEQSDCFDVFPKDYSKLDVNSEAIIRLTHVVRQQAITWTSVDLDLCRYLVSLGHNELNIRGPLKSEYQGTGLLRNLHINILD